MPEGLRVRTEAAGDVADVRRVEQEAFEHDDEADLVDALRGTAVPFVSLVAELEGRVVGHIAFTPVTFDTAHRGLSMGLGPLAVSAQHRCQGIGWALVTAGLEQCMRMGCDLVVVLGAPGYYGRFGFEPASRLGLRCTFDVPEDEFMALELQPFTAASEVATVRFRPEFDAFA